MSLFSSKSQTQIDKLTEENDELKNTLHTVLQKHTSHMELENKIEESKKELARLADIQKDLEDNIQNLNLEKIEKTQDLDFTSNEISELGNKRDSLITEIESIKIEPKLEEIRELEEQIIQLKEEESNLSDAIANYKTEEAKKAASLRNIDERISLSDEVKTNLDSSISRIIDQISEKERENDELSIRRENLINDSISKQKESAEFDQKYRVEKDKLEKLSSEILSLEERRTKLLEETRNAEIIKNQINEEMLKTKEKEEELEHKFNEIKTQIVESEKRKLDVEEKHLQVENIFSVTLQKFIEELNEAKIRLTEVKQEVHDKEKTLNEKEKVLLEKSFQIAEYGGLNKVLQKEKASSEQAITNLKDEQKELFDSIAMLREKEAAQKITLNELTTETDSVKTKKEELEKRLKDFLDQTHKSYTENEKNADLIKEELNEKVAQSEELQDRIEKSKDELRELKEEYSRIDSQKEEFTAKVSDLITQEKNLKQKISELETQHNNLKDENI